MLCLRGFFTQKKWDSQPPILLPKRSLEIWEMVWVPLVKRRVPLFGGAEKKNLIFWEMFGVGPHPQVVSLMPQNGLDTPKLWAIRLFWKWTKYRFLGAYLFPETSWLCFLGLKNNNYLISGSSFGEAVAFPDPIVPLFARKIDIIHLSLCLRLAISYTYILHI